MSRDGTALTGCLPAATAEASKSASAGPDGSIRSVGSCFARDRDAALMRLDDLIVGLDVQPVGVPVGGGVVRICDLTEDSRTVMPGSLFVARQGGKSDGRAFVATAVKAGAVAVLSDDAALRVPAPAVLLHADDVPLAAARLAERFYGDPTSRLKLVGVTGTNGKTTTTFLIHQLLNGVGVRCGLIGTVVVDDGTEVAPAQLTTPPALELSRTFARMLESGCAAAAIEASSHALHQKRTAGLKFGVGVFTNLTHDHLDYHHTMEEYAAAKAILFAGLGPEATVVVNATDPWTPRMLRDCRARVVRCAVGAEGHADLRALIRRVSATGMDVTITGPWGEWSLKLPLIGTYNAMNALQAAAAVAALGVDPALIATGLTRIAAPPGRLEGVTTPADPFAVYVDYAHTDDALERVLTVAREILDAGGEDQERAPKLHVVFGCGGDRDRTKRPKMGRLAAAIADRVIVTSDNPRTEKPGAIIDQILTGVAAGQRGKVVVHADREQAIHAAVAQAEVGDIVIIAGKGHEDYQLVPDGAGGIVRNHFDDREVARAALAKRGLGVVQITATSGGRAGSGGRSGGKRL